MFSRELAAAARAAGLAARHALDYPDPPTHDRDIVHWAIQTGEVIVTMDLDFPRILATEGLSTPSVILFRGRQWRNEEVLPLLRDIVATWPAENGGAWVVVVSPQEIRRRKLPLRPLSGHG
jgi:predicted nuclease of predicted toxin-antitoxin system